MNSTLEELKTCQNYQAERQLEIDSKLLSQKSSEKEHTDNNEYLVTSMRKELVDQCKMMTEPLKQRHEELRQQQEQEQQLLQSKLETVENQMKDQFGAQVASMKQGLEVLDKKIETVNQRMQSVKEQEDYEKELQQEQQNQYQNQQQHNSLVEDIGRLWSDLTPMKLGLGDLEQKFEALMQWLQHPSLN